MKVPWAAYADRLMERKGAASFDHLLPRVDDARAHARTFAALHDAELTRKAETLRDAPTQTDSTMAEVLGIAVEAARRALGLAAFDEQVLAALAISAGFVIEMETGEGKTLVGALAAAMHCANGRRVHVLSVNDYLAERDATSLRGFYDELGITVSWVAQASTTAARRSAYLADVVYISVSELGFDVLRDRLALHADQRVSPMFDVAIVDEADSVMIDEAAAPLVLAGQSEVLPLDVGWASTLVESLTEDEHFAVDDDRATVSLTDAGLDLLEMNLGGLNLFDAENIEMLTQLNLALHARVLVLRDVDYIVVGGRLKLVNSARGRIAHRQRWPDGLHAAVESKEGLTPTGAGVVLDSLTVQQLLKSYRTLSGMSGTVVSVAEELYDFYGLETGRVPRHLPNRRMDAHPDVFPTKESADRALVAEAIRLHRMSRPVLIGTQDIAESQHLAARLRGEGLSPAVLNAKNDANEAQIISRAGELGAVTISTQMSGRGVDIRLGGADGSTASEVAALGGLAVLSSGRFPSRRLDAQLRGRAGRQGDPGSTVTFVSLEDVLVQHNAPPYLRLRIERRGAAMDSRERLQVVQSCQAISEGIRLDLQKSTWNYARAIGQQRSAVLARREDVLTSRASIGLMDTRLLEEMTRLESGNTAAEVSPAVTQVLVFELDRAWQEHLAELTEFRDGIHLRSFAGEVPFEQFHILALAAFDGFFERVSSAAVEFIAEMSPTDVPGIADALGARRPGTTWTYMLTDNPLGNLRDMSARKLAKKWRRWRDLE